MSDNTNSNEILSSKQLWDKAGNGDHISRADVGIREPKINNGLQSLNEGYLGQITKFESTQELKHSSIDKNQD